MSRFMALETDTEVAEVWDEETSETMHITFHGPHSLEMARGCADVWNRMADER